MMRAVSFCSDPLSHSAWLNERERRYLQVVWVEVGLVLVCGFVSSMSVLDHGVQQLLEDLVCLLVSSDTAHGHDEGVACTQ